PSRGAAADRRRRPPPRPAPCPCGAPRARRQRPLRGLRRRSREGRPLQPRRRLRLSLRDGGLRLRRRRGDGLRPAGGRLRPWLEPRGPRRRRGRVPLRSDAARAVREPARPLARRLGAACEARRRQRRTRGPPVPLGRLRRAHAARLRGRARGLAPRGAAAVNPLRRLAVRGVDALNRRGKAVGVRLVKLTRKAPYAIHPKHLVEEPWHDWYLPYLGGTEAVLDVGTSNGAHLIRAARRSRDIVGFDHDVGYTREEFLLELRAGGFEPIGPLMPVVLDTPWAGAIDAVGGLSLALYDRLSRWKREAALRRPDESTGFRAVARKR